MMHKESILKYVDLENAAEFYSKAIESAYAALNLGDIDGFVRDFDPEILRIEFEGSPMAGAFQGIGAVREHVAQGRSTWADGSCEPERFIVTGDKVVALCHVRVRLKGHTDWLDGHVGDVFTFRDGKVVEFHSFTDEQKAYEWSGLSDAAES